MNGSSEAVIPPALPSVAVLLVSEHTNNNQQGGISTSQGLISLQLSNADKPEHFFNLLKLWKS